MTSGCSLPCPGYPDEKCGGNGLYGYVALGKAPAGTKGGISAVPESTERQSSTAVQVSTPRFEPPIIMDHLLPWPANHSPL